MIRSSFGHTLLFCASAAALAVAAGGAGCTVVTTDTPDDAGVFAPALDAGIAACTSCLTAECAGTWAACLTDPACRALHACGTAACVCAAAPSDDDAGADAGAASDPRALYRAFAACNDARSGGACVADCKTATTTNPPPCADEDAGADVFFPDAGDDAAADAGTDGGDDAGDGGDAGAAAPAPKASVDSCASCVSGKCGDAKKACALGTECAAYLACVYAAKDAAGAEDCGRLHATGNVAAVELASCTNAGCTDACGF